MELKPCTRMEVTAIGIDKDANIVSVKNGNVNECTGEEGKCGCNHAEYNLLQLMPNPWYVVVSHSPCLACAKLLVGAGVETVAYIKEYRLTEGLEYLLSNNVRINSITEEKISYYPKLPIEFFTIEGELK